MRDEAAQGEVTVELAAGQSVLLVFGGVSQEEWLAFPAKQDKLHTQILDVQWDIDLRETGREENFRPLAGNPSCSISPGWRTNGSFPAKYAIVQR